MFFALVLNYGKLSQINTEVKHTIMLVWLFFKVIKFVCMIYLLGGLTLLV